MDQRFLAGRFAVPPLAHVLRVDQFDRGRKFLSEERLDIRQVNDTSVRDILSETFQGRDSHLEHFIEPIDIDDLGWGEGLLSASGLIAGKGDRAYRAECAAEHAASHAFGRLVFERAERVFLRFWLESLNQPHNARGSRQAAVAKFAILQKLHQFLGREIIAEPFGQFPYFVSAVGIAVDELDQRDRELIGQVVEHHIPKGHREEVGSEVGFGRVGDLGAVSSFGDRTWEERHRHTDEIERISRRVGRVIPFVDPSMLVQVLHVANQLVDFLGLF